jgi:iron complex outermembrane receptor protein
MPPFRLRAGVRYDYNNLQVGAQITAAADQERVFSTETRTDGYQVLRLFGSYSFAAREVLHTITARADNVTDELYRNHLSLIKEFVPEMGRNFKVLYNVKF